MGSFIKKIKKLSIAPEFLFKKIKTLLLVPELNDERKKLAADLESKRSVLEKRQKVFSGQEEKIKLMELDGQGNFARGNFS